MITKAETATYHHTSHATFAVWRLYFPCYISFFEMGRSSNDKTVHKVSHHIQKEYVQDITYISVTLKTNKERNSICGSYLEMLPCS